MRHTILTIDIHYIHGQSQGLLMQQLVNKVLFSAVTKMVPDLIWALDFFGPQET